MNELRDRRRRWRQGGEGRARPRVAARVVRSNVHRTCHSGVIGVCPLYEHLNSYNEPIILHTPTRKDNAIRTHRDILHRLTQLDDHRGATNHRGAAHKAVSRRLASNDATDAVGKGLL